MQRISIIILILILGLSYAVQDNGKTQVLNPQFNGTELSIPKSINFQGYLYSDGTPMDTTMDMWFGIYDAAVGGNLYYQQTRPDVEITNGWFAVNLTDIPDSVFYVEEPIRYLEVKAPVTLPPLEPRIPLISVGYSFHSNTSDTADYARMAQIPRPIFPPIEAPEIGDYMVINSKLGNNAVNSIKIQDGSIRGVDMAKPCTLQSSTPYPGAVFHVTNTGAGDGIEIGSVGNDGFRVMRAGDDGFQVDSAEYGFVLYRAADDGLWMARAGNDGVYIDSAGRDGFHVDKTGSDGFCVQKAGLDGVRVDSAGYIGLYIAKTGMEGVYVDKTGLDGVYIDTAGGDGLHIHKAGLVGINIDSIGLVGCYVDKAGSNGFHVHKADLDGVFINRVGMDGVYVDSAGEDGLHVRQANYCAVRVDSAFYGVYVSRAVSVGALVDSASLHGIIVDNSLNGGVWVGRANTIGFNVDKVGIGVYAFGNIIGGNFIADTNSAVGLCAIAYYYNVNDTAIQAYGRGYATGGWYTGGLKENKEAPCLISPELGIIAAGTAKLNNGKAEISFDPIMAENIRPDIPVKITVTPRGKPAGFIYITESKTTGFKVELEPIPGLEKNSVDVNFDWIAFATLKEYETSAEAKANWEKMMREREERRAQFEKMKKEREIKQKEIENQ